MFQLPHIYCDRGGPETLNFAATTHIKRGGNGVGPYAYRRECSERGSPMVALAVKSLPIV